MSNAFITVLNMSVAASFVIAAICAARFVLQRMGAPKRICYALWAVAGFRLAVPVAFESLLSLMPIKRAPIPVNLASMERADAISSLNSGSAIVDGAIEAALGYARTSESVRPYKAMTEALSYLWLAGMAAMLLYAVISYIRLMRNKESAKTPFVYGFIKPKIHIPSGLSPERLRYVTLHEETHIKRRDHLVKLFAFALLCAHWFNPAAWAAFALMCADMEMSCDERVLRELGLEAKADYSQTLLSLSVNRRALSASPLAFGEGGVKERIKNILRFKKRSRTVIIASVAIAAAMFAGFAANRPDNGAPKNLPGEAQARITPAETPAPTYDPNFEFENMFEVTPNPERYTPLMSSHPGILLGVNGRASGAATMRYECESGGFLYLESGKITRYGATAEAEFGSLNLHWTPDENTKDGDEIVMRLVDEGGATTAIQTLTVRIDGFYYTLEKSSSRIRL